MNYARHIELTPVENASPASAFVCPAHAAHPSPRPRAAYSRSASESNFLPKFRALREKVAAGDEFTVAKCLAITTQPKSRARAYQLFD